MTNDKPVPLYFTSPKISSTEKGQRLAELTGSIKDGLNKAAGNSLNITYQTVFRVIKRIAPELNEDIGRFFNTNRAEPSILAELRELLDTDNDAKSLDELIERELDEKRERITRAQKTGNGKRFKHIERRIEQLKEAKLYLKQSAGKTFQEENALRRDYITAQREELTLSEKEVMKDDFRAFVLPGGRLMQMRLWHNLPPEKVTGVDLVYEQIDLKSKKMRFVHLQYKMWDGNSFSISKPREIRQMSRFIETFCGSGFCKSSKEELPYRLPFCCAFYKPTHRKQSKDEKIITAGAHIPACLVEKLLENKNSIGKEIIWAQGLSSGVFDELFRNGLAGSGWHDIAKIKKFYQKHKIIDSNDSFVLNIREEIGHDEKILDTYTRLRDIAQP